MPGQSPRLGARSETADDDPQVRALMTSRLVAIAAEAAPELALALMATAGVRHLPVLAGAHCLGVVTETELLHLLSSTPMPAPTAVGALARPIPVLHPDERRSSAARSICAAGVDAALVVDDRQLVGILTATDLIRSVAAACPPGVEAGR